MAKRNPIAHHRCSPSRKRPSRPARRRQLARCWRQDAASFSRRIQDHPQLTRPPANEALHDRPNHEQSDHVEDQVRKVGVKHGSGEQTPPLAIRCTWSEIGAPPDQIPRRKRPDGFRGDGDRRKHRNVCRQQHIRSRHAGGALTQYSFQLRTRPRTSRQRHGDRGRLVHAQHADSSDGVHAYDEQHQSYRRSC
jgi:hypothetical protein